MGKIRRRWSGRREGKNGKVKEAAVLVEESGWMRNESDEEEGEKVLVLT